MPVRGLEWELEKSGLLTTHPVESLVKKVVGVDGSWFLRKYTPRDNPEKTLVEGGNTAVLSKIREFIVFLDSLSCKVVWIWNGMPATLPHMNSQRRYPFRIDRIKASFAELSNDKKESAFRALAMATSLDGTKQMVDKMLRGMHVEVLNAPYFAMAQGAHMEATKYISAFFGPTDYFLFRGAENLITDFLFRGEGPTPPNLLKQARKSRLLQSMGLTNYKLHNLLLLSGCEFCPTIPTHGAVFDFVKVLADYKKHSYNAISLIEDMQDSEAYLRAYLTGKACVEYHPIVTEAGSAACLKPDTPPRDLDAIFGKKLPDEMYASFASGHCTLEYIKGMAFEEVESICLPEVFKCAESAVNSLFQHGVKIKMIRISEEDEQYVTQWNEKPIAELVGSHPVAIEGMPLVLQWMLLLMARFNEASDALMRFAFVFNRTYEAVPDPREIQSEVFEFAEGAKFTLSVLKNSLSLGRSNIQIDPFNGCRMVEVGKRIGGGQSMGQQHKGTLKKNLEFASQLVALLERNSLGHSASAKWLSEVVKQGRA